MKCLSFLAALFLLSASLFAGQSAFELPGLFSDGAVFQQKTVIPVWGKYNAADAFLQAEFAGKTVYTKTSSTGEFMFRLPPTDAGGPYKLVITDPEKNVSVTVSDLLVGEVWIASGQSNMEYQLGSYWIVERNRKKAGENLRDIQLKEFTSAISKPERMRFFRVEKNAKGPAENFISGQWKNVSAENAPKVSACAAWFAKELQKTLDVPVGLIVTSWGGTPVEAWTSRAGLLTNPETRTLVQKTDEIFMKEEGWNPEKPGKNNNAWKPDPGNKGVALGYANVEFDDSQWKKMAIPGSWIAQKISGNGSVWVRKEIELPEDWKGCDLILHTGGIDKHDTTYFNGEQIGKTGTGIDTRVWDSPRAYQIPGKLVRAGKNVIAIRGYSFIYDGGFVGNYSAYYLENKENGKQLNIAGAWKGHPELNLGVINRTSAHGSTNPHTPGILFNGMIRPLIPYAIRGVIWYQGESNASRVETSLAYQERLAAMIKDWRYRWGLGDFPFIQMQLAYYTMNKEFNPDSSWAHLRESQRRLCDQLPNVFMASAIDIGDFYDVHPQDKKNAGKRFAYIALHHVYHQTKIMPSGPMLDRYVIEGEWVRLIFRHGCGLKLKGDFKKSFYIANESKVFCPADEIIIEGNSIRVRSRDVKIPAAVRYAWSHAPESILYNKADLPASSFRTDNW